MAKNNGKYTREQITTALYDYLALGRPAYDICENVLHMEKKQIGSKKTAWRNLSYIYTTYGIGKRYKSSKGYVFRNVSQSKFASYISKYWETYATEKDLLAYFPELKYEIEDAKKLDAENAEKYGSSWGSSSGSSRSRNEEEDVTESYNYTPPTPKPNLTSPVTQHSTREKKQQEIKQRTVRPQVKLPQKSTVNNNSYRQNLDQYENSGTQLSQDEARGIIFAIVGIIIAFVVIKSGIIPAFFSGIGSLFSSLFHILELLFFYGGIIMIIYSAFKRMLRYNWMVWVGSMFLGLACGALSGGNIIACIILFVIAMVFFGLFTGRR